MLKVIFLGVSLILSVAVTGQGIVSPKWSASADIGLNGSINEENSLSPFSSPSVGLTGKYKLYPLFGVYASGSYGSFGTEEVFYNKTQLLQASVGMFYDLKGLLTGLPDKLSIQLTAGTGFATMWNTDVVSEDAQDPFLRNQDDIFHTSFGIVPHYHFSEQLAVNLNYTVFANFKQDHGFDYKKREKTVTGMYNLSLGIVYSFSFDAAEKIKESAETE